MTPSALTMDCGSYLDVTFYEALQDWIGGVSALSAARGNCRNIDNQLPTVFSW